MKGDELLPLNQLKTVHEKLYNEYAKKYYDHPRRAKLLERTIPQLGCLWNDVIHFLPLHPSQVYNALQELGISVKERNFYKIPITNLILNKNVIYTYKKEKYQGPEAEMKGETIQLLDITKYKEVPSIPFDTIQYYEEEHRKGNHFGMFQYIPHILSLGKVNVSNAEVINWSKNSG